MYERNARAQRELFDVSALVTDIGVSCAAADSEITTGKCDFCPDV